MIDTEAEIEITKAKTEAVTFEVQLLREREASDALRAEIAAMREAAAAIPAPAPVAPAAAPAPHAPPAVPLPARWREFLSLPGRSQDELRSTNPAGVAALEKDFYLQNSIRGLRSGATAYLGHYTSAGTRVERAEEVLGRAKVQTPALRAIQAGPTPPPAPFFASRKHNGAAKRQ